MQDFMKDLQQDGRASRAAETAAQEAAVEEVRSALRPHYEAAQPRLAELEKEGSAILREVAEIEGAAAEYGGRGPDIAVWVARIRCVLLGGSPSPTAVGPPLASTPQQVRAGMQAYQDLQYGHIADANARTVFISNVRELLKKWDGALSSARHNLGQMKTYIKEWREARESQGGGSVAAAPSQAVGIIPREQPAAQRVEVGGGPVPPRL